MKTGGERKINGEERNTRISPTCAQGRDDKDAHLCGMCPAFNAPRGSCRCRTTSIGEFVTRVCFSRTRKANWNDPGIGQFLT